MRICHVSAFNNSGMHKVAETMARAERAIGLDSHLVNMHETSEEALDKHGQADIFVAHTHFPNSLKIRAKKGYKLVFPAHGTPEYVFQSSVEAGKQGYGHGDGFMLFQYWMQHADSVVTFWPRHQAIMKTMCDKNTPVHLVPLGIDLEFWRGGASRGKFSGRPSLMTCENSHFIKWAYDILIAWPWVIEEIPDACLHVSYLPADQHRWFFPLINRNGSSYGSHVSSRILPQEELRNALKSVDFYVNPVRYGDHNRIGMEAAAAGTKVISYKGNPYAHFHLDEGDQRVMAQQLIDIIQRKVEPREIEPIPSDKDMAEKMKEVYESI